MNAIAKQLGVSTPPILNWIRAHAATHAPRPQPEPGESVVVMELDELWHFLQKSNCPGSPFAGVKSTCTGRKTMDFQHLNGALAYHYRAKRAYFGQYRDGFSIFACN